MPLSYGLCFYSAQQATIPAFINLVVHTVMYSYYFLATFGPGVKRYLWWKKHLTKMQLVNIRKLKIHNSDVGPMLKSYIYWTFPMPTMFKN